MLLLVLQVGETSVRRQGIWDR